jgi:hypothetical protein
MVTMTVKNIPALNSMARTIRAGQHDADGIRRFTHHSSSTLSVGRRQNRLLGRCRAAMRCRVQGGAVKHWLATAPFGFRLLEPCRLQCEAHHITAKCIEGSEKGHVKLLSIELT